MSFEGMSLITTLSFGLIMAFMLGLIAVRMRLPPIVGYILAGVALGPYTPGYVADLSIAKQLSEIGIVLLMFGVGLHFSIKDLLEVKKIAITGAFAQIAISVGIGLVVAHYWGWRPEAGFVFGLACSVASTVVMMRAMEGGLEHDETIDIRGILRSRVIKVRPIRPDSEDVMPAGYLFWLEPAPLDNHQYPGTEKNAATYSGRTLPEILEDEERRALIWAMEQAGGNQSNAAMLLGIPRQTFSYKWKKLSRAR